MNASKWVGLFLLVAACDKSPSTTPEHTAAPSCEFGSGGGGLAIDASGNVLVTGWLGHRGDGKGSLDGALRREVLIASYGPDGAERWSKTFGGSDFDQGRDVAVDADGNLYVVGQFEQPTSFGGKQLRAQGRDAFVVSLASDGGHRWSTTIGSETAAAKKAKVDISDAASVVTVADDLFIGGYYGPVVYGGDDPAMSIGGAVFVARFGRDGKKKWVKSYPATGYADVSGIAVAADGSLYCTGVFYKDATFGEQRLTAKAPKRAGFVVALDSAGEVRWARSFESNYDLRTDQIAVDKDGRIVLGGWSSGAIDFGGARFEGEAQFAFVAAFEPDGRPAWAHALRERGSISGDGVATTIDANGLVYLAGGLVLGTTDEAPPGPLVVGLDSTGKMVSVKRMGQHHNTDIMDVHIGPDGAMYMTGLFSGSADFGGGAPTNAAQNNWDGFVASYARSP
jgi:hypothetical protein